MTALFKSMIPSATASTDRWTRARGRVLILLLLLCEGVLSSFAAHASFSSFTVSGSEVAQDGATLRPGELLKREMAGGEVHGYKIPLAAGQYVRVLVEQRGINVMLTLFDVSNKPTVEMDSPSGAHGPEYVSAISSVAGDYKLEVRSTEKWANAGRYEIVIEELKEAVEPDQKRVAAERAYADGQQSMAKGTKESRQAALAKFEEAVRYWKEVGERHWHAVALFSACAAQRRLGDTSGAAKCFDECLTIPLEDHDWRLRATILNDRGLNLSVLGRQQEAMASLEEALKLFRERQDRRGQASALNNMGIVHANAGRMLEAIKLYEEAVPLRRAENDRAGEVNVYNNIGGFYDFLGEPQKAFENYNQALQVWAELDRSGQLTDRDKLGAGYNNVAVAYDKLGEWQQALESYERALKVFGETGNSRVEASTLVNLGELYSVLGDHARAMECFDRAQRLLREKVKDPEVLAIVLTHAGQVHLTQGRPADALKIFEEALSLRQTKGGRASTLTNLGSARAAQGKLREALAAYGEALELRRGAGDRRGEALTLHMRGEAFAAGDERAKALADFNEALKLWKAVEDKRGEASSLLGIARVEGEHGDLPEAVRRGEEALKIIESLRTKVASHRLRTAYFATNQDYYEVYINLLMKLYERDKSSANVAVAFQASERARARSLIDALGEAGVDIREGVGADLLRREREIRQKLDAKARAKSEYKYTKEQAASLGREIDSLIAEHDDVLTKIRIASPNAAHLLQPQILSLSEIQRQLLDGDTLLLEFHLGRENSYLWVVDDNSISGHALPGREVIEGAARRLYDLMTAPQPVGEGSVSERRKVIDEAAMQYHSQATALSNMLLSNVAARLGKKRLLVVSDGVLQYLSFGALPTPAAPSASDARAGTGEVRDSESAPYLVEEHEIVSLPSASVLAVLRAMKGARRTAPITVAVLADPVFDKNDARFLRQPPKRATTPNRLPSRAGDSGATTPDEAGTRPERYWQPLPLTREEAAAILEVAGFRNTFVAQDFDANRATLASLKPGKYRFIHFATHGWLDEEHPELSGVVLSRVNRKGDVQDGILRLQDIYDLKLPADMVVLSACSTGLGSTVRGEGLIGLTRGFMYAGSPRVVASLWRVDDFATVRLMRRFYQLMLKEGKTPPAALRQAQSEMLKERRWRLPYFWAAFVIQGEWRGVG